jgi:hypothetical protein
MKWEKYICFEVKQKRDVGHPVVSYVNNVNNITNENPSTQEFVKIKHHNYSNMFRLHTVSQLPTSNNVSFDFPSFFTVLRHVKFIAY